MLTLRDNTSDESPTRKIHQHLGEDENLTIYDDFRFDKCL